MDDQQPSAGVSGVEDDPSSRVLEPLRQRLLEVNEGERYRLLGALFEQLAAWDREGSGTRGGAFQEQLESQAKKIHTLNEEKAMLNDSLAQAKADATHHARQAESEQSRCSELEKIIEEQRGRLGTLTKEHSALEAEVVAKNAQVHQVDVESDNLKLKLQRAEAAARNTANTEQLEESKKELILQGEALRGEMEQLRADKDAEIEQLKSELLSANKSASHGADAVLSKLWERLATARPALVKGGTAPTLQAVERFFDAFVELAGFAHDFEQDVRPFLDRYTKYNERVKRPWEAYRRFGQLLDTIKSTIAVQGGKPVGVLKMRLWSLKAWTVATLLACDSTIECVEPELENHLRGSLGTKDNPNCPIREYMKDSGPGLFGQHLRELRGDKLSEAYGVGS